ncbi:MAG: hypothetical protein JWO38_821 [Gemmataceae bacterium]|nr:hypothetical protein [Gemmataceae bacterium]
MAKTPEKESRGPSTTTKPWVWVGISRTLWYRLKSADQTPRPIDLGLVINRPIYRTADLDRWVATRKTDRRIRVANAQGRQKAAPTAADEPAPTTQT